MTDLPSSVYDLQKFHFIFHFSDSEREKERKREKYLEGGPEGAPEQRQSNLRSPICDEGRATMATTSTSELRRRNDMIVVGYWVWFAGVWFWIVYWGFFFF